MLSRAIDFAMGVLVLIGILLAFGVLISKGILKQLGCEPDYAAEITQRIAEGDLAVAIALKHPEHPEHASLLTAIVSLRDKFAVIVSEVRQGSESVATASAEIAQGNQDLSARTESQASALEETAASMEQLSATVKQNADSARQANQLALNASTVAVQGGAVVAQVVDTMKGINDSSRKIADINAVNDAKEIRTLINASVEQVEQGTALVDKAGSTMTEVVSSIRRMTDIMGEISAASSEQSLGVSQVGEAVTQMDQVTQQNAALVEETAAAASSLQSQAQDLVQVVAVFKLGAGESAGMKPMSPAAARAHPPAPNNFKGGDRRVGGVPKGAAARGHSTAPSRQAPLRPVTPAPVATPKRAAQTTGKAGDCESF